MAKKGKGSRKRGGGSDDEAPARAPRPQKKAPAPVKKPAKKAAMPTSLDEAVRTEVDEFMEHRDVVRMEKHANGKSGRAGKRDLAAGSDSEDDDPTRKGHVLDLDLADSDDMDEMQNGDDAEEFESDDEATRLRQEDAEEAFEEQRNRAISAEESLTKQWGKKKSLYYDADTAEGASEEDEEAEEKEAQRLQAEHAMELDEADFEAPDAAAAVAPSIGAIMQAKADGSSGLKTKKGNKRADRDAMDTSTTNGVDTFDMDDINIGFDTGAAKVERLNKDLSKLSKDEKLQIVMADSPELIGLLDEFKTKMQEVREHLHPLLLKIKEQQLPTDKGISFLELKFHLLLNYCINIAFYLYMKAEGRSVKDHPVVQHLVQLRVVMEKIRPIEQKLKYQIDKLLKAATLAETAKATASKPSSSVDPLSFRPNPRAMMNDAADGAGDMDKSEVYRPPKLAAVQEKELMRKQRQEEKRRQKAMGSSLIQSLRDELTERPTEETALGLPDEKVERKYVEREAFEEEHFIRLPESKADRKHRTQGPKLSAFDDFDDFGDLTQLMAERKADGDDDDMLLSAPVKGNAKRKAPTPAKSNLDDDADFDFLDDEALEAGAALYDQAEEESRQKKKKRKEEHPIPAVYLNPDDGDMADGRREAGNKIVKNRGLVRYRPKDEKNPRVKRRKQYEEKMKKRRSVVQDYQGQTPSYGGQATGIKANLVRSTKLH